MHITGALNHSCFQIFFSHSKQQSHLYWQRNRHYQWKVLN